MMRFFYVSGSPYAWRVQLALEEKGIEYEPVLLSFQAGDTRKPEYLAISPHGKVPALVDGDVSLYESQAIVEYLEDRSSDRPLLPAGAAARARVRIEETEATLYFFGAFAEVGRLAFFTPSDQRDEQALGAARAESRKQLERLELRASRRGGDFVMGETFTRADLSWLPFVEIADRGGVERASMSWLAAWHERMRSRASYDRTYPPHWRK